MNTSSSSPRPDQIPTGKVGTPLGLTRHIVAMTGSDKPLELPGLIELDHNLAHVITMYQGNKIVMDHVFRIQGGSLGVMLGGSQVTQLSLRSLHEATAEDIEMLAQFYLRMQEKNEPLTRALNDSPVSEMPYALELPDEMYIAVRARAQQIHDKKFGPIPLIQRPRIERPVAPVQTAPQVPTRTPSSKGRLSKIAGGIAASALVLLGLCTNLKNEGAPDAPAYPEETPSTAPAIPEPVAVAEVPPVPAVIPATPVPVAPVVPEPTIGGAVEVVPEKALFIKKLEARFNDHMERHPETSWDEVEKTLKANPDAVRTLESMELDGGEPDVIFARGYIVFGDCVKNVPAARLNVSHTQAMSAASTLGVKLMSGPQYFALQRSGEYDTTGSVWLRNAPDADLTQGLWGKRGSTKKSETGAEDVSISLPNRGYRFVVSLQKTVE